ncbi:2-oxoglutarate ferredoxin oxidoreductase subunit alpha [Thermocladium modestius]|uniref:2-oxoacid oxidoreductase (ferredoxin) n=1 Tax=Thermocladium modestius TaxID=62609 RepID=A0A830GWM6_9CREN|nr:2-oxoacid:acceptor oxidoreductase subunit alpha [Thermocladium modestius]GGP20722.1 2-oxoglutarate ferredoxin oxidoreductase subunit alpha [Thermocladium modestius]
MSIGYLTGNQAVAEGAMAAGLKFYAGYPITPASDLFEYLSEKLPKRGGVVYQGEDEIASIVAAIGASWSGAKAMTATSGPGFSLMAESIGLAAMTETPVVVAVNMRTGPSTGIATTPGQGDVMQSRWLSHGHYPVVVYAPTGVQDSFDLTIKAFNVAEALRIPAIILSDAAIAHGREKVVMRSDVPVVSRKKPTPGSKYLPYEAGDDLVPPMAAFGEGFNVLVESLQHDERGYYVPTSKVFEKLVTRLNRKVDDNRKMIVESRVYGEENADVLLVAFGSYARVARGAARRAREEGLRVRVFVPISIWPLDEEGLRREASRAGSVVVMENNLGQLYREVQRIVRDRDVGFLPLLKVELPTPTEALRSLRGMVRA